MPICIECRYPVPQLYHVLHSTPKPSTTAAATPANSASAGNAHHKSLSGGALPSATLNAKTNINDGLRGAGEAKKSRSAGADVRLTQCPRCKRFADKYVEHDFVVLFIDLVLVKPQVYRHLLINRLGSTTSGNATPAFDPNIVRLGVLLTLFDVYLTWSRIEALPSELTAASPVPRLPIPAQYIFFLLLSLCSTIAQHLTIRMLSRLPLFRPAPLPAYVAGYTPSPGAPVSSTNSAAASRVDLTGQGVTPSTPMQHQAQSFVYQNPTSPNMPPPQTPYPAPNASVPAGISSNYFNATGPSTTPASSSATAQPPASSTAVSTAIFVSSCMKLFPILMVVWPYEDAGWQVARGVRWAVAIQNLEALRILLGVAYWKAGLLVLAGKLAEELTADAVLRFGGLGEVSWMGWRGWG